MSKKYDFMQKKYPFNEFLYINALANSEINQGNKISEALHKNFNKKLKTSLKSSLSLESRIEENEQGKRWIIEDEKNNQKFLLEKDEDQEIHVFNVVPKLICSTCATKFYSEDVTKCSFCTSETLIAAQERFPEVDSNLSFPCPSCKSTLSVDVVYEEENRCQCGKRIEICNNCQGVGFVKSTIEVSDKQKKLLNSGYLSKQIWKAKGISTIPIILFIACFALGFFSPVELWKVALSFVLIFLAPFILWKIFVPKPLDKSLLVKNCTQCGSGTVLGKGIS